MSCSMTPNPWYVVRCRFPRSSLIMSVPFKLFICHDNLMRAAMESEQYMDVTTLPRVQG